MHPAYPFLSYRPDDRKLNVMAFSVSRTIRFNHSYFFPKNRRQKFKKIHAYRLNRPHQVGGGADNLLRTLISE